ncbi:isochorismatase family protein [Acinetobacter gerneri]|uniref:isochorismatase family protein n=1 Tax=Acinetobacter gerneri TaxID=202952 RepID=UPI00293568F8|nr:isochorismatase family protein [Acinetobacter gerneri]MDV2438983.1 isochorismatase family protein [Acinetobacter gerneri]
MTIAKISDYPMPDQSRLPQNKTNWQLDPDRAVLLIHDMQRYFLNFYDADSRLIATMTQNLEQLRQWADQHGVPVVYTAQPYEQPAEDRALLNAMWGAGLPASTPDQQAIISPLTPKDRDVVLTKWRYSAFQRSDLQKRMQNWQRDQLIIGGVYAHIGCMVTAIDAFMNDIQAFFVADALADFSEQEHLEALKYVSSRCGQVTHTQALTASTMPELTEQWLYEKVQKLVEEEELDPAENLILYGLDSLRIMQFSAELKQYGLDIYFEELGQEPSIEHWWNLIQSKQAAKVA